MNETVGRRQDIGRVTLTVLFIGGLLVTSVWVLRPFLPAILWATVRMLAGRNILEQARRVTAPTLLLWGARDRTVPLRLAAQFVEHLPRATLHVMPDSFHQMPATRPAATAAIIHDFIGRAQA